MFNWRAKAVNSVFLEDNVGGKGKYFKSRFLQPGLVKYSFGVCVLEKDTIDKFIDNFVGCPVIINHKEVTDESAKNDRVGAISRVWYDEKDGWYWGEGVIFDEEALSLIDKGYNVSCQYEITEYAENKTNALHNGNEYDKVILGGKPEHLAIVENPRYENAMIAVNAIEITAANEEKEFRTVGEGEGQHVIPLDYITIDYKENHCKNAIIEAINSIKESDMFKSLFKKEKKMTKDEMKAIFMECLQDLKASNEAEEKTDAEKEEKAENETDYKKLYEELKAKFDASNKCKNEDEEKAEAEVAGKEVAENEEGEETEKAKNAIEEQKNIINSSEFKAESVAYVSKAKALELGDQLF